ncbi:molybdopterin converting factor subunit 1 [Paenibacillus sp. P96]|uniref:Molybdopterin converting factor subunit 1 n=1 Tax=Paenibacillus zeirhizosphaerae TaxID=2987519 RepID=A0ABT9FT64_9BACL|nr:molybdopterin converting factor subunit 1 [Paenibacillus sp. P96]MDP4097926.1 molybdopterin converting factor subunit 1 [Paenibacillus sp. P96]
MNIEVLLFAGLAEHIGSSRVTMSFTEPSVTAGQVKTQLAANYPEAAAAIQSSFIAVNQEFAALESPIHEGDEVAVIPPVSGGDGLASYPVFTSSDGLHIITQNPLSPEEITAKVITANHGATLAFVGTTREMTEGRRTVHLEYEAYVPMALNKLSEISRELAERWPGTLCAIAHKTGKVDIAEASVIIAVSAPHRDICYDASRYAIETLKHKVPIWKKEIWKDGSEWKGSQLGPWNPLAPPST